ncbi:WecB/TagA/CpsF family glycosyltransferase [Paracidobacterium acidisoli]|uniref:WecB/TagA/CpsF family glycosyltransferase n=1 Tax=Paracidobacterium acidisoli TaxID=2303751 RepID=UPI0013147C2A|nr:WecB/TagA/CpsF family glycosyltransferase [Paracidobacterium acidisoli]
MAQNTGSKPAMHRAAKPVEFRMDHVYVDRMPMNDAAGWVVAGIRQRAEQPLLIVGPNAQIVTLAEQNRRFASALQAADLSVADGVSVVWASRLLGKPVPERVTGGDLMERLCAEAAAHGFTVFFLGGLPEAAEKAAATLTRRYPGLKIAGTYCPPLGFEADPEEVAKIREQITQAAPDLLCVAFGAPRQEIWMHEHCPSLPIRAAIAVGAALDTQAGLRHRAPAWTHRLGVEWLYRLLREPRRLWRRYLIGNTHFIWLVFRLWIRQQMPVEPLPSPGAAGPD